MARPGGRGDLGNAIAAGTGRRAPEKWEGLTIGPRLRDGSYLVLAGTDDDYLVTQNGGTTQFDVNIKPLAGGRLSRIAASGARSGLSPPAAR